MAAQALLAAPAVADLAKQLKGSQTGKIVGYAVAGTVGVVILAVTYPMLKNQFVKLQNQISEEQEVSKYKKVLREAKRDGIKPTYTEATYKTMANKIFAAIDGRGTDELAIYQVMQQIVNNADYAELVLAFGRRTYGEPLGGGERNFNNPVTFGFKLLTGGLKDDRTANLMEALREDLDEEELNRVRQILKINGVTVANF